MLSEDTNIRFFAHPKMCQIPIGVQGDMMNIFEDILNGVKEDNPDATISELLSTVSESIPTGITEPNSEFTESAGTVSGYVEPTTYTGYAIN